MTHKVHPIGYRLSIIRDWKSRWLDLKHYSENAKQDYFIRDFILKKFKNAGIESIEIERFANQVSVIVYTSRPGILIGRGGSGTEEMKRGIAALLGKIYQQEKARGGSGLKNQRRDIRIEVREIRDVEKYAQLIALNVAEQLERRIPFRRVIKRTLDRVMANKEVQGAKIMVKGRLDGADMGRTEFVKEGKLPLQTLRADIDFAHVNAITTFGVVGVKVWIYRGEKLE
jgi:small subunit ribosomal protein S3